jgi:hypothetical protein
MRPEEWVSRHPIREATFAKAKLAFFGHALMETAAGFSLTLA